MVLPVAALMMGLGVKRKLDQDSQEDADRTRKQKMEDEDRAYALGQRDRTLRQQGEADSLQTSMKAAATPATVDANMVPDASTDNRDVGLPGTAPATQDGYRVNGQVVPDEATATKTAAAYNTPVATMQRQAKVLTAAGKPVEAIDLKTKADAVDAQDTLKQVGSLLMNGGWASVPEIYARYNDGKAAKVVENGNGGATVITIDEKTGKEVGKREFTDLPHLFATIAGRFDPSKWVADETRRAADAESGRRWEAEQGVREKNADSTALLKAAQAEASMARAAAAAARGAGGGKAEPEPVADSPESTFDRKTATDIAKDLVKKEAEEAAIQGKRMSGADVARRVDEVVGAMRQTHTNRFVMGQVQRALGVAQNDPAAYAQEYGKALRIMPQSELLKMGFKPPAGAAPAAVPVPRPGAAAQPAAAAPAAAAAPVAPAATMASTAGQDKTLQAIEGSNRAALDGLAAQVATAKQQLAAVTKSGDPAALARYAQAVTRATEALKTEAAKRLGNRAPAYLQTVL